MIRVPFLDGSEPDQRGPDIYRNSSYSGVDVKRVSRRSLLECLLAAEFLAGLH